MRGSHLQTREVIHKTYESVNSSLCHAATAEEEGQDILPPTLRSIKGLKMPVLTVLMFVLLLTHYSFSKPQCHSCVETSFDCSRRGLREVPAAPSELITELDLSFNSLKTITNDDFVAYARLKSLIMKNNMIKTIQDRAFLPLTNLEKLDLSSNLLDTLSAEWFENLVSLQYLNLLGNPYRTLGQGNLFQPLKRLKSLHFGGVNLKYVRKHDFSGLSALKEVIFDGQNLQAYAERSLRQIGPVKYVTLGLNGPFQVNEALVEAVLRDVAHPNTTLTFTDTFFSGEHQMYPFKVVKDGGTTNLILKNVTITIGAGMQLLNMLSGSKITRLTLEGIKFFLGVSNVLPFHPTMKYLEEIVLNNIDIPQFYSFPALLLLHPLMTVARRVSVQNCTLFAIPCDTSYALVKLEYLDISYNILSDLALKEMMCDGKGVFQSLQTINISRNYLRSINSQLFTKLNKLENIDMSGNMFYSMDVTCYWPPRLRFLNLSSTYLTKVTPCLPVSLRILDVSDNALTVFNVHLPLLTELYISGNKLTTLPEARLYPHVVFLSIKNNDLHTLSSDNLNRYNSLRRLEAGANTYVCSCDFVAFMTSGLKYHRVTIGDKSKSYICDSPDTMRQKSVKDARLSVFECHTALAFSVLCFGLLAVILLIAGLCHKFSVVWYMRMTWAWLRAKRKPKLKKGELKYDAFVSYSEMDTGWVEAHLIPEMEEAEPPLKLCLHKRDFIPGGWILDNIMDAIEKSHRTLFVLSQHFVRSEWCKYELDYTHFRLFDQNDDAVVLILLEPIDKETIPKKFCRLRKIMNSRTYLEWPGDDDHIPRFWQSLRTAIQRPEIHDGDNVHETPDL